MLYVFELLCRPLFPRVLPKGPVPVQICGHRTIPFQ